MNNEQKQKLIEKFLVLLTKKVEKSDIYTHPSFKTLIVAGSYADWKKNINGISAPSWRSLPDINIYLIINGTNKEHLMISNFLARIYNELTNELDFNLLLDLHPFYKSYGNIDEKRFNLQLTTRVINSKNLNMYPDYCWFGWQSNFYELCSKEQNYLNKLYNKSINRVTVITLLYNDITYIISMNLNLGNNSIVDSLKRGGMTNKIDIETGTSLHPFCDRGLNNYYFHPITKEKINKQHSQAGLNNLRGIRYED